MLTVNLHSDAVAVAIRRFEESGDCSALRQFRQNLRTGGVSAVFCAVGGDVDFLFPRGYTETLKSIQLATRLTSLCGERLLRPALSLGDLGEAGNQGTTALVLGMEGGAALEGRIEHLDALYQAGLRWLSLTWNLDNELGHGCGGARPGGLTSFGEKVIQRANTLGIVIDLSHASSETFKDAVAVCNAPFIVSHSNSSSLCPHPRNLTDAQIEAVAHARGVVGVNFFPRLLCADRGAEWGDIERHIRYITSLVGIQHVALGPDFIYAREETVLEDLGRSGVDYGLRTAYPDGFSDDACFREVAARLARGGVAQEDLGKIMGENALRVLEGVQQAAEVRDARRPSRAST